MLITNVQIRETKTETRLAAIVSVTFDSMIVIHDIKIIRSEEGYFLAMPSRKVPNGTFKDVAHPISKEARTAVERIAVGAYNMMIKNSENIISLVLSDKSTARNMLDQQLSDFCVECDALKEQAV